MVQFMRMPQIRPGSGRIDFSPLSNALDGFSRGANANEARLKRKAGLLAKTVHQMPPGEARAQRWARVVNNFEGVSELTDEDRDPISGPLAMMAEAGIDIDPLAEKLMKNKVAISDLQLANAQKPAPRKILEDVNKRQRYLDTGELVFPDVETRAGGGFKSFKDRISGEQSLRKEFTQAAKTFRSVRDAHSRVEASAKNPSAAGDLALVFNYMKVLDPGSTVREGEFATAQNSAGLPERLRAQYNQIINGQRLAPKQRLDFLARSRALYRRQEVQHMKLRDQYVGISVRLGLDTANTVPDFGRVGDKSEVSQKSLEALRQAQEAIEKGADPGKVYERLRSMGIDPGGLR